jgi:hypothetical protein
MLQKSAKLRSPPRNASLAGAFVTNEGGNRHQAGVTVREAGRTASWIDAGSDRT